MARRCLSHSREAHMAVATPRSRNTVTRVAIMCRCALRVAGSQRRNLPAWCPCAAHDAAVASTRCSPEEGTNLKHGSARRPAVDEGKPLTEERTSGRTSSIAPRDGAETKRWHAQANTSGHERPLHCCVVAYSLPRQQPATSPPLPTSPSCDTPATPQPQMGPRRALPLANHWHTTRSLPFGSPGGAGRRVG